jgi:putative endonuclease
VKQYYVYIMANKSGTLYTGVTNDLERRLSEHKSGLLEGFTKKYHITRLMYFDSTDDVIAAIAEEKRIKGMLRSRKIELIKTMNPRMIDLSADWNK